MLTFLSLVLAVAGVLWVARSRRRRADASWQLLAQMLGLPLSVDRRLIVGRLGGMTVQVEDITQQVARGTQHFVRVLVSSPQIPGGIEASSEGVLTRLQSLLGRHDIELGEPEFDRRVRLGGDEDRVVAFFDLPLRQAFSHLLDAAPQADLTIDGRLVFEHPGRRLDAVVIEEIVRRMVDVAHRLVTPDVDDDVAERLARLATEDPDPARRQRGLELLVEHHPNRPPTRRVLEGALRDGSASMRLLAARSVDGSDGFAVLRELVEEAPHTSDRAGALATLIARHPYPLVAPVLETVLHTGRPELRELAVRAIGNAHDLARLDDVLRMRTHDEPSLCEATALVLGQIGDARAEPRLLELLAHEDSSVRTAAARSLGIVGTVAAVEPLLSHSTGLTTSGALKEAARDSIRAIQSRLGSVEAGRLSIAADDGKGALSLAGEGGALTLEAEAAPSTPIRHRRRA